MAKKEPGKEGKEPMQKCAWCGKEFLARMGKCPQCGWEIGSKESL